MYFISDNETELLHIFHHRRVSVRASSYGSKSSDWPVSGYPPTPLAPSSTPPDPAKSPNRARSPDQARSQDCAKSPGCKRRTSHNFDILTVHPTDVPEQERKLSGSLDALIVRPIYYVPHSSGTRYGARICCADDKDLHVDYKTYLQIYVVDTETEVGVNSLCILDLKYL